MISLLKCRVTVQLPNVTSEVENLGGILECKQYLQEERRSESALWDKMPDYKSVHYQKKWVILFEPHKECSDHPEKGLLP